MENIEANNNNTPDDFQIKITEDIRSYIYDMAKWANFLGFFGVFLAITFFILALTALSNSGGANLNLQNLGNKQADLAVLANPVMGVALLFYAVIVIYPSILMIQYAKKAKDGILYDNQSSLENAFYKLKSLFKYFGIIAAIGIIINILTLLGKLF